MLADTALHPVRLYIQSRTNALYIFIYATSLPNPYDRRTSCFQSSPSRIYGWIYTIVNRSVGLIVESFVCPLISTTLFSLHPYITYNLPFPRTIRDTKYLIKIEQHRMYTIFSWLWQFRSNFPGNRMCFSLIFSRYVFAQLKRNHIPKFSELILCSTYKLL